jgi:Flp pilus assembly protein TadG
VRQQKTPRLHLVGRSAEKRREHLTQAFASRQSGSIAVMCAVLIIPLVVLCGFAIDLGMVYNRKAEMHNFAHAIALSAAKRLNGTPGGITDAVSAANAVAAANKYRNFSASVPWDASALTFSTSPDRNGAWVDAGTAAGSAARMFYVKVDTRILDGAGDVETALIRVLDPKFAIIPANSEVIAGRLSIQLAPLAICAMSATPAAPRTNSPAYVELVEYGFRRGVSYDLMNLNPNGTTPVNFVINPVAAPGAAGSPADMLPQSVSPYACRGSLDIPRVTGDPITVAQPFPLSSLYSQLNSRFDQYDGSCTANGAPPDLNIKAYDYRNMPSPIPWMNTAPAGQTAASSTSGGILHTVADLPVPGGTAAQYGPLWAYAKAVPFSAYKPGIPEPDNGYATFTTASWPTLYGGQTVKTYPASTSTPYKPGAGVNLQLPSAANGPGKRNRRVLNVPLLSCSPVPSGSATVLAIGRFFMTVPATPSVLAAEFAGTMSMQSVGGNVGVFE